MLNQPAESPELPPRSEERVQVSDIRKRADDAELQREIRRINREMEFDYD